MMWPSDRPGDIATAHPVSSCDDAQLRRTIAVARLGLTHRPGARPGLVRRTEGGQPRYGAPRVDHFVPRPEDRSIRTRPTGVPCRHAFTGRWRDHGRAGKAGGDEGPGLPRPAPVVVLRPLPRAGPHAGA